jgi:hypothetical protein
VLPAAGPQAEDAAIPARAAGRDDAARASDASPTAGITAAGTQLQFGSPGAARIRIRVYDVRGRVLRRDVTGRDGTWTWDGRDGGGRRLARGVYFVGARGAGIETRYRIVWAG